MDKNNFRLGLYEKALPNTLSMEEKFIIAKEIGYDWIELSIDASDDKISRVYWNKEQKEVLINLMRKYNIKCETMNISALTKYALGSNDSKTVNKGMDIVLRAIDLANDIGARFIQIPGYDVYFEPKSEKTHQRYMGNIKEVVKYAACKGVILGLETMEDEYMNTVEKALKLVKEVNSPYLKIYPDIGNITNALLDTNITLEEDLLKGEGHIVAIHLKETKPGIYREVHYGLGNVNFNMAIKAGYKMGIGMYLGEFWDVGLDSYKEDATTSYKFLNNKLKNIYGN